MICRKNFYGINFTVSSKCQPCKALGRGTFGDVYEFRLGSSRCSQLYIAIKRVKAVFHSNTHMRRAMRELRIMNHLNGHPNIIGMYDADLVSSTRFPGLYCYMELMDCDLGSIIRSEHEILTEWHILHVPYQLLCALNYMHSAAIVHRDLKPGNILVSRQGTVKICDFGLARCIIGNDLDKEKFTAYVTTRWYRAPEIIGGVDSYHSGLDMWALGAIIAEIVLREPLFRGKSSADQLMRISAVIGPPPPDWTFPAKVVNAVGCLPEQSTCLAEVLPPGCSLDLNDLLHNLLVYDPDKRLTALAALEHQFFAAVYNPDDVRVCSSIINTDFENEENDTLFRSLTREVQLVRSSRRYQ